ncbi:MAG: tetratricopeptide repeat protein [SAR324 cluster bacterium]|nr:tetratricopeptide repeat protein [SAR324 cluster bacterium]
MVILTLTAYYPASQADSIMDDINFFIDDPLMTDANGLQRIWFHPLDHNNVWPYLPMTRTTFWLERQIWGLNLQVTHWINILIHLSSALLLWQILQNLKIRGAWWVGMLFALHPIYVQSVAWIAERKNVLAAIFYLLCLWAYLHFDQKKNWRWYWLTLLLFLCALFSKTSTIMLPAIMIFCRFWMKRSWKRTDLVILASYFLIAAGIGFIRIQFELRYFGAANPLLSLDLSQRFLIAGHVPFFYLSKLAFPYPLVFTYSKWNIDPSQFSMALPLISVVLTAGFLLLKFHSWGRPLFLGLGAFLAALFPVLGFFNNAWTQFSYVADHWVHLPSIPILILGTLAMFWVSDRLIKNKRAAIHYIPIFAGGSLVAIMSGLTWNQSALYENHKTLWNATLHHNPESWVAYLELGRESLQAENLQEALRYFEETLKRQESSNAYLNRAVTYFHLQQYDQAIADNNRALQIQPKFAGAYHNRGFIYAHLKRYQIAIMDYNEALKHNPRFTNAYYNRGNAYMLLKQPLKAIEDYKTALKFKPDYIKVHHNLGLAYLQLKRYEDAIQNFNQAIRFDPEYPEAYHNRGIANFYLKQYEQALQDYEQALLIKPNYPKVYNNRAFLYLQANRNDKACQDWKRACQLGSCQFYHNFQQQKICP